MKTFRFVLTAALFLLWAGTSVAQTHEEKKEALKAYVDEQVEARTFKIDADMAYPMSGRSIPLSTPYGLQMKKDSVDVCLPYFGRAYQIPYGGGEGLRFKAPVENYSSSSRKTVTGFTSRPLPVRTISSFRSMSTTTARRTSMCRCATASLSIIRATWMQPGCNRKCVSLPQRPAEKY